MISWELVWLILFLTAGGGLLIVLVLALSAYYQRTHQTKKLRFMIYLAIAFTFSLFMTFTSLIMTSRNEFCANCHEMKPYTEAFKRSVHSQMSCLGCHGGQGVAEFGLHKIKSVKEPYLHLTNSYDIPINGQSELSKEMKPDLCERCHDLTQRKVTAPKNLKIDHAKHKEHGITCPVCHNRVAHPNVTGYEGQPTKSSLPQNLKLVAGFEKNRYYPDRLKMRYCMRCHTGEKGKNKGPKECKVCHPARYEKKSPQNHKVPGFKFSESTGNPDATPANYQPGNDDKKALHAQMAIYDKEYCLSCHEEKKFCYNCHQVEMPHPKKWNKQHGEIGKAGPEKCVMCHGSVNFCDSCHHKYDPSKGKWISDVKGESLHPNVVRERGASFCFECHDPIYCARCHVRGTPE
jgi:nitrate/TMAO reductase-like tetraheme cytochrome c subunit